MSGEFDFYCHRFGSDSRTIAAAPPSELSTVVVIPCFNEPDLLATLASLRGCERPQHPVEVIVVINCPADADSALQEQTRLTTTQSRAWAAQHIDPKLTFHILCAPDLPPKHAGVGLARKIGMDEAARRFCLVGRLREGIIACLDADCLCEPNYLVALENHFFENGHSPGCSIYFEHPLSGPLRPEVYSAIALYELHLRYYVQGLRYAGFPFAHHTVGSAMAVRPGVYLRQGGMNKRKAAEDFYFLHKVIPLGGFTDLIATRVIPSPRPSDRVPFGTGRAVRQFIITGGIETYHHHAFFDLKVLFDAVASPRAQEIPRNLLTQVAPILVKFLEMQGAEAILDQIAANTASPESFQKRFCQWFNGFMAMKFIHYACDHAYGYPAIPGEAGTLLALLEPGSASIPTSAEALLERYRFRERTGLKGA